MVTTWSIDGQLTRPEEAAIKAADRGFTLGDGAFETIRVSRRRPLQLDAHLARLWTGLAILSITPPPSSRLRHDLARVVAISGLSEAVVRITVSRGAGLRGLAPPAETTPSVVIAIQPFEPYPQRYYDDGISAAISTLRRNEFSPLCRFKSLSQADNVLARIEAQQSNHDLALLRNTQGMLICADCANLFIVTDNVMSTPPIHAGALPGTTRGMLCKIAGDLGLEFREQLLCLDDLRQADAVLLTNVILEVAPLVKVDGIPVGSDQAGQRAALVRTAYSDELKGR